MCFSCSLKWIVILSVQQEGAWLVPLTLQLFPALVLLVGMAFMPYSPRWLIHHDREAEARKVLATLRGLSQDSELIEIEFLEIKAQSVFEKRSIEAHFPSLKEQTTWNTIKLQFVAIFSLFKTRPMFRRVIVATVTMVCQPLLQATNKSDTCPVLSAMDRDQRCALLCPLDFQQSRFV